jgi:hypothetical protein
VDEMVMNIIATWLYLVGTNERARKLRARIDTLEPPPLDKTFGPEPPQCPTTVLFGAAVSRALYVDKRTRPALDAWDNGYVTRADLRRWCLEIEKGKYTGPIYEPPASMRPAWQTSQTGSVSHSASRQRTPGRPTSESRGSTSHAPPLASPGTVDH